jgi:TRAP-type C4-dicarboxylate transport system substrate-binding protein
MITSGARTRCLVTVLAAFVIFALGGPLNQASGQEEPIIIKMASPAPANSEWHRALQDMGAQWEAASNGMVKLQIHGNGQGGEEKDVFRAMRLGKFQAGGFTLAGLQFVTPAVCALAIPSLMKTQEDLHRVRAAVGPELEEIFLEKGYVLLHWVDMGWMQFFTPESDPSPKAITSYTYPEWGENALSKVYRAVGFSPGVRLNLPEISMGLDTGLVDAINTAPLAVYGYQWFQHVDYMIDVHWAPLSGATLVDRRSWEKIPAHLRPQLARIARETGERIRASLVQWEADAVAAMEGYGVQVVHPPQETMQEWEALFQSSWDLLRGELIPEEMFERALVAAANGKEN